MARRQAIRAALRLRPDPPRDKRPLHKAGKAGQVAVGEGGRAERVRSEIAGGKTP
jgi:hypothetical protein